MRLSLFSSRFHAAIPIEGRTRSTSLIRRLPVSTAPRGALSVFVMGNLSGLSTVRTAARVHKASRAAQTQVLLAQRE